MSLLPPMPPAPVAPPRSIDKIYGRAPLIRDPLDLDRIMSEILERETFDRNQLAPIYQRIVKFWRLYYADRDDPRKSWEKWRANTFIPYPYSGARTKVAAQSDILLSSDPLIQVEGIGPEDEDFAKRMEAHVSYIYAKNRWPSNLSMGLLCNIVQGTNPWEVVWVDRKRTVVFNPTREELDNFNEAVGAAVTAGAGDAPTNPKDFEEWRRTVNTAGTYGTVPELPVPGPREICSYKGPAFQRVDLFSLRLDPMVEDVHDQEQIVKRVTKPWSWVEDRTGPGKMFDAAQVEKARGGPDDTKFSEYQTEIAGWLGISADNADPSWKNSCEILVVTRPADKHVPYALIINRKAICNNNIGTDPIGDGEHPYVFIRNAATPGHALGMSDFQQTERLYHEQNTIRDLRIDSVVLGVLPMFEKLSNVGITELQRRLQPGGIIDVQKAGALKKITSYDPGLQFAFQEIQSLKDDIDETNSTPSHVRGGSVALNRVSATEAERRFSQAIIRIKQDVLGIEEDLQPLTRKGLFLQYRFADPATMASVGGQGANPMAGYSRYDFLKALDMDFRFRSATKSLNRDLSAQQMQSFIQLASSLQVLPPTTLLKLLRRLWEGLGQKGASNIITDEDIQNAEAARQQQEVEANAQTAPALGAARAQNMEAERPVPEEVELNH